jgi:hypothetical protein
MILLMFYYEGNERSVRRNASYKKWEKWYVVANEGGAVETLRVLVTGGCPNAWGRRMLNCYNDLKRQFE